MSRALIDGFIERLAREPAVLVSVDSTQGSVPREVGAGVRMRLGGVERRRLVRCNWRRWWGHATERERKWLAERF